MQVRTKAIVLSSLKYSDSSLIVRCYTEISGIKSYLLRGVLKSKKGKLKPAYFQPLTQLELLAVHSPGESLNSIKEAGVYSTYIDIYSNYTKQAIVFFVAEMLSNSMKEEEENQDLYAYIETSLNWLDLHDTIPNFHLVFFTQLTKYLGFYPDDSKINGQFFNLSDGVFTDQLFPGPRLQGDELILFKTVLGTKFDTLHLLSLNVSSRQIIMDVLIQYYGLHLANFKKPKSIEVLKNLFA